MKESPRQQNIEIELEQGRSLQLSAAERERVWSELHAYTELHDVPTPAAKRSYFHTHLFGVTSALCTLLFVSIVGVSAQSSLPGEFLYPIKVDVIEPAASLTKFSSTARAEHHTSAIARRLHEVRELAKITPVTEEHMRIVDIEIAERTNDLQELFTTEDFTTEEELVITLLTNAVADVQALNAIESISIRAIESVEVDGVESQLHLILDVELTEFAQNDPAGAITFSDELLKSVADDSELRGIDVRDDNEMQARLLEMEQATTEADIEDILRSVSEIKVWAEVNNEMTQFGAPILIEDTIVPTPTETIATSTPKAE